ncbi:MAG: hypothetical protein AABW88_03360 [Nanoarchaeota archaeon]
MKKTLIGIVIAGIIGCSSATTKLSDKQHSYKGGYKTGDAVFEKKGKFWKFEGDGWRKYNSDCNPTNIFIPAKSNSYVLNIEQLLDNGARFVPNFECTPKR